MFLYIGVWKKWKKHRKINWCLNQKFNPTDWNWDKNNPLNSNKFYQITIE
jgi:hypothetical protein